MPLNASELSTFLRRIRENDPTLDQATYDGLYARCSSFQQGQVRLEKKRAQFAAFLNRIRTNLPPLDQAAFDAEIVKYTDLQAREANEAWASALGNPRAGAPPAPAVAPSLIKAALEPLISFTNNGYDWLTYETLFNQRIFRKTNQECVYGLYRIPLRQVKVCLRDDIEPQLLTELTDAFFPDLTPDRVVELSNQTWDWKAKDPAKTLGAMNVSLSKLMRQSYRSPSKVGTSRMQAIVSLGDPWVVMPFNYIDNTGDTIAIGCRKNQSGTDLVKLEKTWKLWKTASRSCVGQIERVKPAKVPWEKDTVPYQWQWDGAGMVPGANPEQNPAIGRYERGLVPGQYDLSTVPAPDRKLVFRNGSRYYSIKTGAQLVGVINQGVHVETRKDKLDDESIISPLRSDLVNKYQKEFRINPRTEPSILVLTELLTITELDPNNPHDMKDGVQVRDLSLLDQNKVYFPPICIPFFGLDLRQVTSKFHHINDQNWCDFWKANYAVKLGEAKAILLLKYGMQGLSPNGQNFLLEFNKPAPGSNPQPTGRIVFRDLGDMLLHREVTWILLGGPGNPPDAAAPGTSLGQLDCEIIKFECDMYSKGKIPKVRETGTEHGKPGDYSPPGTRPNWSRFSILSKSSNVASVPKIGTSFEDRIPQWKRIAEIMCDWGIAHNRAYVNYLQTKLGLDFRVDWNSIPLPARYGTILGDAQADFDAANEFYKADIAAETEIGQKVHDGLIGPDGLHALRSRKATFRNL